MRVLIIEDEQPAVERLKDLLKQYDKDINVVESVASVADAVQWLKFNKQPDLILLDIQLNDGLSLEIFNHVNVTSPVIFSTAYDQYILDAFNHNGIDYILKPVKKEKLFAALDKYKSLKDHFTLDFYSLVKDLKQDKAKPKERITARSGIDFVSVNIEDIAYFYTEHKIVFLVNNENKKYTVDKPLSDLEEELPSSKFFRVSRKYLCGIGAIKKFRTCDRGRLELELYPPVKEKVTVSTERASEFKKWIEG